MDKINQVIHFHSQGKTFREIARPPGVSISSCSRIHYEQPTIDIIINSRPIISAFSRCLTVSDAFHQLLGEKSSEQELEDSDRYCRNLGAALVHAKANLIAK